MLYKKFIMIFMIFAIRRKKTLLCLFSFLFNFFLFFYFKGKISDNALSRKKKVRKKVYSDSYDIIYLRTCYVQLFSYYLDVVVV